MEQIAILDVLRRHASMIIALCIVATITGYALCFLITNRYTATALVLVRPQQPIKMGTQRADKEFVNFPMGQSSSVETPSKTYIEIIKSTALIENLVGNLGLDKEKETASGTISKLMPDFLKPAAKNLKQTLKDLAAILMYGRVTQDDPFTRAVKQVQDNLSLKSREDTYLFEITYKATDPQLAADIANTTSKLFIDFMEELRLSEAQHIRKQLETHLEQSRQQLESARQRLEDYKNAHSVFLYESEYNSKLKVISELQVELSKAEEALVGGQNTLSNVSLAARRARLIRSLREQEAELGSLPGLEHALKQFDEDVKAAATAYEIVDKEVKEADMNYSYTNPEVRLVSQAVAPHLPSSPARGTIAGVSFLGGLVVGVFLAFLLEYLDHRVRSIQEVENFVGIKVLATIPRLSRRHAGLL